jgi:hypothetical protein
MTNLRLVFNRIFRPNDGSRQAVHDAVSASVGATIASADRLIDTVREVMERNDRITKRQRNDVQKSGK